MSREGEAQAHLLPQPGHARLSRPLGLHAAAPIVRVACGLHAAAPIIRVHTLRAVAPIVRVAFGRGAGLVIGLR